MGGKRGALSGGGDRVGGGRGRDHGRGEMSLGLGRWRDGVMPAVV